MSGQTFINLNQYVGGKKRVILVNFNLVRAVLPRFQQNDPTNPYESIICFGPDDSNGRDDNTISVIETSQEIQNLL